MPPVRVAVIPEEIEALVAAVTEAGGRLCGAEEADAVIWTDPRGPLALAAVLEKSPARWVQLPFAGIEEFVEAGVVDPVRTWTCAKGVYGPATAELALALVLASARQLHRHAAERRWMRGDSAGVHRRIAGSTILLVGTGGIGRAFASMVRPLGVRLLAVNRAGDPLEGAEMTAPFALLDSLVGRADWIVLAAALTPETTRLFDGRMLSLMKPDAWIVNVARGRLIDTAALVDVLLLGAIGGAALDVTDPEPLPDDHALWSLPNVIVTSHTANTWRMAVPELGALVRRNVERFGRGQPLEGLVDPGLGY